VSKRIGITGGIGAGKSMVSKIIESMGFPVFNSDEEAKKIINYHPEVKTELIALLDDSIYSVNGLDRPKLAELIFKNPMLREKVNQIVHPRVRESFDLFALNNSSSKLVFNEAAILFETGAYKQFDSTILITAPLELRIKRIIARDNVSRQEIELRMNAQWPENKKEELASFIILNDEVSPLLVQVELAVSELLN